MKICLIPVREGSKRIKNKNIINFLGKPIISYYLIMGGWDQKRQINVEIKKGTTY